MAWLIACFPRFTCARIGGKLIAGFNDSFPLLSITALFFRQTISLAFSCCFPTSWLWVELLLQLSDHKLLDSKFYLEKVLCSTVHSILCGAQRSNCNQVLTKQGVGRKRIKAGLKQDATFSDQMLKFLVFGLGFWTGEGSQRETAPAEPRLTEENEFYCTASSGNFQTCSWCLLLVILCHPCCCKCSHSC